MNASLDRRSRSWGCSALLGLLVATVGFVYGPGSFIGRGAAPTGRSHGVTRARGYRLDKMFLEDYNDLQVEDGYWLGEVDLFKALNSQGLRYKMRPMSSEQKELKDAEPIFQLGPLKVRIAEAFGGSANNDKLRAIKRKLGKGEIKSKAKIEENEYWLARYGHKRWGPYYVDQSTGIGESFFRGLAAWSGYDPLKEERGVTWFEADYGKPFMTKYIGWTKSGPTPPEQQKREYDAGKVLPPPSN